MTTPARKLSLVVMVSALLSVYVSSSAHTEYCADLEISAELHLTPSHPLAGEPLSGSFYVFDHLAWLTTVDHFQRKPGTDSPVRLQYLETDTHQILDRTVKTFEILRGRFGALYADKSCFYTRPVENTYSFVSVHSYFKHPIVEVPSELPHAPEALPPLTSLSLIRIFRTSPEYLVVAGNYESNGELGLHIDGAKDGDWLNSSLVPAAGDSFVHRFPDDRSSDALKKNGIPARIDVDVYLRSHRIPLEKVSMAEEIVVLNQHYRYNKLIRQDELTDGTMIRSRFLEPSVTKEENVLNPLCESRLKQQHTLGFPTVQ